MPYVSQVKGSNNVIYDIRAKELAHSPRLTNKTPYLFRPSFSNGYGYETLIGGTCGVNQLVQNGNFADSSGWLALSGAVLNSVSSNIANVSFVGNNSMLACDISLTSGHTFLSTVDIKLASASDVLNLYGGSGDSSIKSTTATTEWQTVSAIWNGTTYAYWLLRNDSANDVYNAQIKNVMIIDLTAYFGTTIADYVYTLESGTSGAGITWLKNNGFFGADYYPYNAGGLLSVKTSKKINTGKNLCNADNPIVLAGEGMTPKQNCKLFAGAYTVSLTTSTNVAFAMYTYDENDTLLETFSSLGATTGRTYLNFTVTKPCNKIAFYINASTTITDIQVELGSEMTDFEPYVSHEYPLDDIELRGILKLDGNNNLYYDGDNYESNGSVTRKYGIENTDNVTFNYDGGSKWLSGALSGCNTSQTWLPNAIFALNYNKVPATDLSSNDRAWTIYNGSLFIRDTSKTENELRAIIADKEIVYELATPFDETVNNPELRGVLKLDSNNNLYYYGDTCNDFTNPMIVDGNGTEEFVDTRAVQMPVGHETIYVDNSDKTKLDNLPDISDSGDGTYVIEQTAGDMSLVSAATVATTGSYNDLTNKPTIPSAQVNSDWNSTSGVSQILNKPWVPVYIESEGVYQLRQTPITANRTLEKLVGVSCAFNQLIKNGNFADTSNWTDYNATSSVNSNILTVTANSQNGGIIQSITLINTHKYLISVDIKTTSETTNVGVALLGRKYSTATTNWQNISFIDVSDRDGSVYLYGVRDFRSSGWDSIQVKNVNVFDLTSCFGSEVADYLYTLESNTAGSGIALFRQLFPEDYYAYQTATLISSKPVSKVIYDSDNNVIATYPLGGDELRGLLKVENGQLVAYGDVKPSDGNGTEVFAELNLTWGDFSNKTTLSNVIRGKYMFDNSGVGNIPNSLCDKAIWGLSYSGDYVHYYIQDNVIWLFMPIGTSDDMSINFIYEKATPTAKSYMPFTNPMLCGSTEEFTDSRSLKMPTGYQALYYTSPFKNW